MAGAARFGGPDVSDRLRSSRSVALSGIRMTVLYECFAFSRSINLLEGYESISLLIYSA